MRYSHKGWGGPMFQNDLLDVAIGIVFVWFVLSLVISVVNEGLGLLFRIRAKHLWLGIDRLLNPKTGKYARRFWDTVLFLPFSRWLSPDLDVRPTAIPDSSDLRISDSRAGTTPIIPEGR